ncbi:hypothetical protein [Arthrobacter sp. M4]|uniref:hypothetical protein n=1 Tax=Arthrobacter sp. M4 TaxID=218160 RepID=UPI001CDC2189|nr:hypothetical protein [Arthrobacter sp. M4]MCA4132867.1 hypothetical protein [Arthrobacter sp. M4]
MSTFDSSSQWQDPQANDASHQPGTVHNEPETQDREPRVGTIVWGLVIIALAALIVISKLGLVVLNGTYVLIGLMIGAGAALVVGGLLSIRGKQGKRGGN